MADDLTSRGPANRTRINLHDPAELEYWTKRLGVGANQLTAAVIKVGYNAEKVRRHLGRPPFRSPDYPTPRAAVAGKAWPAIAGAWGGPAVKGAGALAA